MPDIKEGYAVEKLKCIGMHTLQEVTTVYMFIVVSCNTMQAGFEIEEVVILTISFL